MENKYVNLKYLYIMGITLLVSLLMTAISFAERGYGLDEFDDLELESLVESLDSLKKIPAKKIDKERGLILVDDNLYLIDDDFDFGEDELELQKLELDPNEMETAKEYVDSLDVFFEDELELQKLELDPYEIETAKEYVDSLNAFFEDSTQVGTSSSSKPNRPTTFRLRTGALKFRSTPHDDTFSPTGANGFGISTIVGPTMPITMEGVSLGYSYGIQIDSPISFKFGDLEGNVGTELIFSSMASFDHSVSVKLTSIIGNFSLFPSPSLEIKTGLGFTPEKIKTDSTSYITFSALSIPVDINYYLPVDFSGQSNFTNYKVALNLHIQRTLADGRSDKWFGADDGSYGYVQVGILIQFYKSFFH